MAKRQLKPEPFSIEELEEIAKSPVLQGFEKALQYRPILVTVEDSQSSTVVDELSSTVDVNPSSTVEDGLWGAVDRQEANSQGHSLPLTTSNSSLFIREENKRITVEDRSASPVEDGHPSPTSTVEAGRSSTVPRFPSRSQTQRLWIADGAGGVFTESRVRKIQRVQDALTHIEEAVYDALWGSKKDITDTERLCKMGYTELAQRSRVSKRSIQSVIDRLIEKNIIEIATPADISRRQATIYRVPSYSTILKQMREHGRHYVVRTGKGVFFAAPLSTVDATLPSTVEDRIASTVEDRPTSTVEDTSTSTVEASSRSTVERASTSTVEATSTPLIGSKRGKKLAAKSPSNDVATLASDLASWITLDDQAVEQIWNACRQGSPECTAEEVATLARTKQALIQSGKIDNPAGLLITSVPKFFENGGSAPLRQMRELGRRRREEEQRQQQELRLECQRILADPNASIEEKEWAQSVLNSQ